MTDLSADEYLTTAEVAARLRMTQGGLRYWRHAKKGPPSFKVGDRTRYAVADVIAWENEQKRTTTRGDELPTPEAGAA